MTNNRASGSITSEHLLRHPGFVKGFYDARSNYLYDQTFCDRHPASQAYYERGRHFAQVYDGPLHDGPRIRISALINLKRAVRLREVL